VTSYRYGVKAAVVAFRTVLTLDNLIQGRLEAHRLHAAGSVPHDTFELPLSIAFPTFSDPVHRPQASGFVPLKR
jgi:hypothetical protein